MSSRQHLREFIRDRLTAAAEEIFSEFEKNIIRCEEKIKMLDVRWKPQLKLHKVDLPRQHVSMEEEDVSAEQPVCNKKTNCKRDQEQVQIKKEEEEVCHSEEEEEQELEGDSKQCMLNLCCDEDLPRQHGGVEEEEAPTDQLICNQKNSNQDQEEPEVVQIKEEQDEICSSPEEEQPELREEINGFMPSPSPEDGESATPERCTGFLKTEVDAQIQSYTLCLPEAKFSTGSKDEDADKSKAADLKPDVSCYTNITDFPSLSESDSKYPFKCGFCGKTFKFKSKMIRHVATHVRNNKFTCGVCMKSYSHKGQLVHHMRMNPCGTGTLGQHAAPLAHAELRRYVCGTCGKRFSKSYILKRHVRLHTGEKPFTCGTCGKSFSRKDHMLGHMKTHRGESAASELPRVPSPAPVKPMPVHVPKKLYSCEVCGKQFRRHRSFLYHMKTHRGVSSFICKTCGKHFNQLSKLTRHQSVHTGLKPFSCNTCGKSLSRRDHLLRHMRLHADGNSYD